MQRRQFLQTTGIGLAVAGAKMSQAFASPNDKEPALTNEIVDRDICQKFLNGPISSVRTPFQPDGQIDEQGLRSFIDHSLAGGSKTVLLTAGDSQFICMTDKEIARVTKIAGEHTAGRALVVAADNNYATPASIEFAKYAKGVGANVLMCLPPDWAGSSTVETFVEHYCAVAEHIPVMLVTNVLGKRGHDFAMQVVEQAIDKSPAIVAVKDDLCGEFGQRLSKHCLGTGVVAFAGGLKKNHMNVVPVDGGPCYMSPFQVGAPHITQEYWSAIEAKDLERAQRVIDEFEKPFFDYLLTCQGGWNAGWHGALEVLGVAPRWRRKPYYSLNDAEMEQLKQKLIDLKILRS